MDKLLFIFLLFIITINQSFNQFVTERYNCIQEDVVCLNTINNLVKTIRNVPSPITCSLMCQMTPACNFFTFYSSRSNMFLANHCLLYASCDRRREGRVGQDGRHSGPVGTYFGRRDCSATDCLLAQPRGGQWFWSDRGMDRQSRDGRIVRDNTKVFFICGDNPLEVAHCVSGKIMPSLLL